MANTHGRRWHAHMILRIDVSFCCQQAANSQHVAHCGRRIQFRGEFGRWNVALRCSGGYRRGYGLEQSFGLWC